MSHDDTRICWLGAFAMGLAFSSHDDHERVNELVDASAGETASLQAARRRVGRLRLGDPSVCRTALRLLDDAIERLTDAGPVFDLATAEVTAASAEVG